MPIVQIDMMSGRSLEQKENLIKDVTEVIVKNTGASKENVHIILRDMEKGNYGAGGAVK